MNPRTFLAALIAAGAYAPSRLREPTAPGRQGVPVPPPAVVAKRNDPCPCGSGKKFKRCCIQGGAS